jgi:hypothetical protein
VPSSTFRNPDNQDLEQRADLLTSAREGLEGTDRCRASGLHLIVPLQKLLLHLSVVRLEFYQSPCIDDRLPWILGIQPEGRR